jgi:hypothetical protein
VPRPKYFPFFFPLSPRDSTREPRPPHSRDSLAAFLLGDRLSRDGFELGTFGFDTAPRANGQASRTPAMRDKVARGDLLVTVGRLCTHPEAELDEKKPLRPPLTELGRAFAQAWIPYFREIVRSHIFLSPSLEARLPERYASRRIMWLSQREGSRYRALDGRTYAGECRSPVFALRLEELWPGGAGYLGAFGMDATMSLLWAQLLRDRYWDLVREPGFVMAELAGGEIPDPPTDIDFAREWNAEVVLHVHG